MSSISSLSSALNYASGDYPTPKPQTTSTQPSTPSAPQAEDSIHLSPEGHAALKAVGPTKLTHAQLVLQAASGNPIAKAKLKTEKQQAGIPTCS